MKKLVLPKLPDKLPKNFRIIPGPVSKRVKKTYKSVFARREFILLAGASFISGILFGEAILSGRDLYFTWQQEQNVRKERHALLQQEQVLENAAKQYANFRDVYLQLAVVEYQLQNKEKAMEYVEKALSIDPNDKTAQQLQKEIEQ